MAIPPSQQLRTAAKAARRSLSVEARLQLSDVITRRFLRTASFMRANNLGCYIAAADEVETSRVFERAWYARKRIFAPVVEGRGRMRFVEVRRDTELVRNRYGLWEPRNGAQISARKLDAVVVPVVAFDDAGNRIGMGSGYYDRCFAHLRTPRRWRRNKLVGFAFDCQNVEKIPPNPWDIPLYRVITQTR